MDDRNSGVLKMLKQMVDVFNARFLLPMASFSALWHPAHLKYEKINHTNIHVISNFFTFGNDGKVTGYKSGLIHTYNKNEVQVKNHPYGRDVRHRPNVILLGDALSDIDMSKGIAHEEIISIGFLNKRTELLDAFKQVYDIIIVDDAPLDYVLELVKEMYGATEI